MNTQFILGIVRLLIAEAPGAIGAVRELINKDNPTDADYDKARAQIEKDSYEAIVTHSDLPKDPPNPA